MRGHRLTYYEGGVHIMTDIETVGIRPGSMIAQIAGVAFLPNAKPGKFEGTFVTHIHLAGQEKFGLTMDPSTVEWWLEQDSEAIKSVFGRRNDRVSLGEALQSFNGFCLGHGAKHLWGHGATFDNVLLNSAYGAVDQKMMIGFRGARDTRTLFDLVDGGHWDTDYEVNMEEFGPKHDALADAKRQAVVVQRAVRIIREWTGRA